MVVDNKLINKISNNTWNKIRGTLSDAAARRLLKEELNRILENEEFRE